jgi:tetratricopeptide (TPR) repeat protein
MTDSGRTVEDWLGWIDKVHQDKGIASGLLAVGEALAACPDSDRLFVAQGQMQTELMRVDEAEASFQAALERRADNLMAKTGLARIKVFKGEYEAAKALAASALAGRARKPRVARVYFDTGDYEAAAKAMMGLAQFGASSELALGHDQALAALGEDAEAGIAPRSKRSYTQALERLREGDPASAERLLRVIVHECPAYAPGWVALRGALEAQGRTGDAKALAAQWRDAAPPASQPRAGAGFARVLGRRGFVFDPRDRLPLVSMDKAMVRAETPADLRRPGDSCFVIDPGGELIEHDPVVSLDGSGEDKVPVRFRSAPKYVAGIDNALLAGETIVIDGRGQVVRELLPPVKLKKLGAYVDGDAIGFDPYRFNDGLGPVKFFDTPAFLMMGPTDRSFGDWMINIPPRLLLAEAAELDCPIVIRSEPQGQTLAILRALGVPESRILFHEPQGVSVFPRLYAPSWPTAHKGQPSKDVYGVYRRAALSSENRPRPLLYLSRKDVKGSRQMLNEDEVCELFRRRGFQIVDPGVLGFEEVRSLFSSAACVAGPFGSAFHNLAFCSAQPTNLVILPSNNPFFLTEIALWHGELGQRFVYLHGRSLEDGAVGRHSKHAAWLAPLDKLDQAIDRVLETVALSPEPQAGRA